MTPANRQSVRINRTFFDLPDDKIIDLEQISLLTNVGGDLTVSWEALLRSQRVLLISEAGAGKTHECQMQRRELWNSGEAAFFLDLAELSQNAVRELLAPDEEARLDAWHAAQSTIATFFLDSIDELQLTLGRFETALNKLRKEISGQLHRVRIIITTRPVPFDRQKIEEYFPVPELVKLLPSGNDFASIVMGENRQGADKEAEKTPPSRRFVALTPLSNRQMYELAVGQGVDDPDAMLSDIQKRNAEEFARRPMDLIELCADWKDRRSTPIRLTPTATRFSVGHGCRGP